MSGGTGRRRKPPVGGEEGGGEQYASQQPPAEPYPQYQTYQQPAPESYDYDWRQGQVQEQPAASTPAYEAPAAYGGPSYEQPAPTYQPPQYQPQQQPAYEQYQAYPEQPAAPAPAPAPSPVDFFGSGSYEIPRQQSAAPARPRPTPRAEPQPAPAVQAPAPAPAPAPVEQPRPQEPAQPFEFEFDPEDEPAAQAAPAPAPVTGNRPADKDGYRPDDFSFVDEPDNPDVKGWLSFSESRADSRAERIRTMRARLIAVGVVLVLIAAGVGVYVWFGGSVPGLTNQSTDTKQMILFRLDDSKGDAVGDALLVTDRSGPTATGTATGSGAIVVIPSQMQIDSSGFGSSTFGGDMASDQPPAGADEVAGTFGVTPDGVRDMDETTFGIFVDEIGGLSVTTNTAVPASAADPKGVPLGATTLTGVQAVAYATYAKPGESAGAQAARFGQVMDALIAKLPSYTNEVQSYLNLLGLIPDPSLPLSKLSPLLAVLAAQRNAGQVTLATLPLTSSGTLDAGSAAAVVSRLLGGTVKASATASG
ncbi:MAG TPA: hypothetical protein VFN97_12740 [Actinospica sp.]|nr:hypothetical protein [Actinospica sp.]